ncbi:MAG: hypothetical protein Q4C65_11580 [Eubacteriales bacterium]|nr:hypothetical protein [Eubacteriales bacterium]
MGKNAFYFDRNKRLRDNRKKRWPVHRREENERLEAALFMAFDPYTNDEVMGKEYRIRSKEMT